MSRKHRDPDLAGWLKAAADSEAGKQRKRRRDEFDSAGMKRSRFLRRKGRSK